MPQLKGCETCGKWIPEQGPPRCPAHHRPAARTKRPRGRAGQAMRAKVLERDGHQCRWPGCDRTRNLEVHHVIPIEDAPDRADDLTNQVTLCKPHHLEAARQYRAATRDRRRRRS